MSGVLLWSCLDYTFTAFFHLRLSNQTTHLIRLVVESLSKKRKPSPDKNAVYFISPTLTSVQQMLNDFEQKPIMYGTCNVFCLAGMILYCLKYKTCSNPPCLALSDSLFDRIKSSVAKQYMRNLVELNIDFTSPDPNYFSINAPEAFFPVFNPEQGGALLEFEIDTMAKRVRHQPSFLSQ